MAWAKRPAEGTMPNLPERKVGIIACSGEEIPEGAVTRLAALKVLHELRRRDTVTICLPLFLAGGEGDRAFAKFHPTITVDGCDLKCAAKGTETYSGKPAVGIVVSELAAEHGIEGIGERRCLNPSGQKLVDLTAGRLSELVDQVLGKKGRPSAGIGAEEPSNSDEPVAVGCSCGSKIPVKVLPIAGRSAEVIALPLIFSKLREAHPVMSEAAAQELMEIVKSFNDVPKEAEASWREVIVPEYAAFCERERQQ